jgi:hypothetical protein
MPAIHAGMTKAYDGQKGFQILACRYSPVFHIAAGEHKIMNHFLVKAEKG